MTDRPDIVLVITDQQRYDQVGYRGGGHYDSPNLDELARRGVVFEAAYSASTTCVPARVGLLTGLLHHRVPTQSNLLALREGFWTIAHALRDEGYETALIGKAHFYPMRAEHGFETVRLGEHLNTHLSDTAVGPVVDELDDYHDWLEAEGCPDWRLVPGEGRTARQLARSEVAAFPYHERFHPTAWVEHETLRFLETRDAARPLFLVVSFLHPHAPLNPPEPYASMYDVADADVPVDGFEVNEGLPAAFLDALTTATEAFRPRRAGSQRDLRRRLVYVRALIKQIDDALERILGCLDLSTSLVWFTSDHGDYGGHRGMVAKYPWMPFDDLARVPLVVAGVDVAGGRRVRAPVQSCDFALTALDYAGIAPPDDVFDTRSLRPVLHGASGAEDRDRAVACATGVMGWPMVRRGNLKYIAHAGSDARALFDLDRDPGETTNVLDEPSYRSASAELSALLASVLARTVPDLPTFAVSATVPLVTTGSDRSADQSAREDWLRRSGLFREVTGYAEAVDLLNDPRLHVNMVSTFESLGVTSGLLWDIAASSLLSLNGEEHRRQRALVARRFSPRAVEQARPRAHDAAHNLVSSLASTERCEFVTEFATPYVRKSTCAYIGFPEEDVAARWPALELIATATKDLRILDEHDQAVLLELADYAASALEERRRQPRDDILTVVAEEMARGSLPEAAALGMVTALLSAGHEPTIKQLAIMVTVLGSEPEVWDALGRGEVEPAIVVEAVLRYRSTNQAVMRRIAESFEYGGVRFEEGGAILISLAAANHDPRQFAEPDQFHLEPTRTSHLSFGFGPHHCLGAALARVQLQEAVRVLTHRLACPEILEVVEGGGAGLVGPSSLALSLSSRSPPA